MKSGDIVVNVDGWIGIAVIATKRQVRMQYEKCGKTRIENWDIDSVRLANESEIEEHSQNLKTTEDKE